MKYPTHIWSIDFERDKLSNGRSYKILAVLDAYTREALYVAAALNMGSADVLDPLMLKRGKSTRIRPDNGPEFTSARLLDWLTSVGIQPIQIYPRSTWENGYNEGLKGMLRREVLNAGWFARNRQAPLVIKRGLRP